MDNLLDSYLFMSSCREVVSICVENSKLSKTEKNEVINFILKEATDYQVLSLLIENKIPKKKYHNLKEMIYLYICNESLRMVENEYGVTKHTELVPLFEYNMSSNPTIAKYMVENNLLETTEKGVEYKYVEQLVNPKKESKVKKLGDQIRKTKGGPWIAAGVVGLATGAIAAGIIFGARKLAEKLKEKYKDKGKKVPPEVVKKSIQAQIRALTSSLHLCNKSKEPAKCRAIVLKKVGKLKEKLSKIK